MVHCNTNKNNQFSKTQLFTFLVEVSLQVQFNSKIQDQSQCLEAVLGTPTHSATHLPSVNTEGTMETN